MKLLADLALLVAIGVLLVGCGSRAAGPGDVGGGTSPRTLDATYLVTGATSAGKAHQLVDGTTVRLVLDVDSLTITAGCNTMSGAYSLEGTRLTVRGLAGTEMGCEQPLMDQDAWLAGLFARPVQLNEGDDAAIISGDVVLSLEDWKDKHPDPALIGTSWVVSAIGEMDGDAGSVSSLEKGVTGSLRIADDGSVVVYDGCNSGAARAVVAGEEITFTKHVSTLRGCIGDSVGRLQKVFGEVLDGTASFLIDDGTLILTHGPDSLHFRAAARLPAHD